MYLEQRLGAAAGGSAKVFVRSLRGSTGLAATASAVERRFDHLRTPIPEPAAEIFLMVPFQSTGPVKVWTLFASCPLNHG